MKPPQDMRGRYYEQAATWAKDREDALRGSRRIAWVVAAAAAAIAVTEAIALAALAPLKTVEPLTLLVDRTTGYVQALKPLDPAQVAGNTALTQSFLVQYVIARESFDSVALQDNYRKVSLWSEGSARRAYVAGMQASNTDSFLARLPRSSVVETRVKSVSPMGGDAALVRFDTVRRDAGGQTAPAQSWVAVVRYRYSTEPMSTADRYVDPLGFRVQRYQRNAEVPTPPPEPPAHPAGSAAPLIEGAGTLPGAQGVVIPAQPSRADPTRPRAEGLRRLPNGEVITL